MPILTLSPAVSPKAAPVGLYNTFPPVTYRVTVTTCAGKLVSQSPSVLTLNTGETAVSTPASNAPRIVTFAVQNPNGLGEPGVHRNVAFTARQGCSAAAAASAKPAALPTAPIVKTAHAGTLVAPPVTAFPVSATIGGILAIVAIAIVAVMMTRRMTGRTKPKPRGEHAGSGKTRGGAHR